MRISTHNCLKCIEKDVVDWFVCFVEEKKTNFENFSVGQNLVIFQTKTHKNANFRYFFFDHPFFDRKQTNCPKNHMGHSK
jgi:hypothetical protein